LQTPSPFGNDTAFILPTGFFLFRLRFVLRGGGPASLNIQLRLYPLGDGDARTAFPVAASLVGAGQGMVGQEVAHGRRSAPVRLPWMMRTHGNAARDAASR
jgi:hypothetical protein